MAQHTPATTAQDPVCHMEVDTSTAKHTNEYRGQLYYFCSVMCLKAFEDDPERYLERPPQKPA